MTVFYTADTHFGHEGILRMCQRPFDSVAEMDQALVDNWNSVVRKGDSVYHLGDFAYRATPERVRPLFDRLNGSKHLVIGNHDGRATLELPWASPPAHRLLVSHDHERLVLDHYGLRVWPGHRRGALHLYGHSHGRLPGLGLSTDVGVDVWDYRPVRLEAIKARMALQPEFEPEVDVEADEARARGM